MLKKKISMANQRNPKRAGPPLISVKRTNKTKMLKKIKRREEKIMMKIMEKRMMKNNQICFNRYTL